MVKFSDFLLGLRPTEPRARSIHRLAAVRLLANRGLLYGELTVTALGIKWDRQYIILPASLRQPWASIPDSPWFAEASDFQRKRGAYQCDLKGYGAWEDACSAPTTGFF
jgi:hypothetical protein